LAMAARDFQRCTLQNPKVEILSGKTGIVDR
jgi:hypothetical protein